MSTPTRELTPDDFDAALVPGFRDAVRVDYEALDVAWRQTASAALDDAGAFRQDEVIIRFCPVCGADTPRPRFFKLGMEIVDCGTCEMTYSRQAFAPSADRALYRQSPFHAGYRALKRNSVYMALEQVKCAWIMQELGRWRAPPGRLLDIGAGSGRLLHAALKAGWQAHGVEANPAFAGACIAEGLEVSQGFFPEAVNAGGNDVVVMLDVLEHVHNPVESLVEARLRLVEGGVLVLQVPNFSSLLIRAEGVASTNFCHGHWNHFTAGTLVDAARRAGFTPLAVRTVISEADRIAMLDRERVASAAREIAGAKLPAQVEPAWLYAHGMGYKLIGFFGQA